LRKVSATYVLPISWQGDTLKNFKDQRLHWPFSQWLIQLSKYRGFCMLALLFLVVVNAADFHQVGAASSAPSWMKEGAYMKYKLMDNNEAWYLYVEFAAVHENTAEMIFRAGVNESEWRYSSSMHGFLDLVTGQLTPLGEGTYWATVPVWIPPQNIRVNGTEWYWYTPDGSGFPPDNEYYSRVECWTFGTSMPPPSEHGLEMSDFWYPAWYDKVTGILIEMRAVSSRTGLVEATILLYETNIPVGRQGVGLAVVETLTANSMTYATVLIAAVGAVTVVFVAFVMLRKRTPIVCGQCGRKMRRGNAFCDKCGTALASSDRHVLATPASDTR